MDTTTIETAIVTLPDDCPTDTLLELGDKLQVLAEFVKEMKRQWEARMVARIQEAGPIVDGQNLYRVGEPPQTKCNNIAAALEAVLTATAGDFEKTCECLSANALKHGACKAVLGDDEWAKHFTVTRTPELTVDEATPARLKKIPLMFVRGKTAPRQMA